METRYVRPALAAALFLTAALASSGAARAQGWNEGPWIGSWPGPNGSRCFAGTWSRSGAYNSRMSIQAQFCIGGGYPSAFGAVPWTGAYPTYPGAIYPNPFNTGYGPSYLQPNPYSYAFPPPWGYAPW
jgi:hypothetical protein